MVQKFLRFYWSGGSCLLVELHFEGSVTAVCAADLFDNFFSFFFFVTLLHTFVPKPTLKLVSMPASNYNYIWHASTYKKNYGTYKSLVPKLSISSRSFGHFLKEKCPPKVAFSREAFLKSAFPYQRLYLWGGQPL